MTLFVTVVRAMPPERLLMSTPPPNVSEVLSRIRFRSMTISPRVPSLGQTAIPPPPPRE